MQALLLSSGSAINTPAIFESHFPAKLRKMRVAYIKNAKDYLGKDFDSNHVKNVYERWFKYMDIIDLYEDEIDPENYDVVWMSGGMVGSLHKAIFETGFDKKLKTLLAGGMYYVGSSAGAMIASTTQKIAGWYPDEEEPDMIDKDGLGWVPFEIFPHYIESQHKALITEKSDQPTILLPDNSAVGIDDGELRLYNQARFHLI